MGIGADFTDTRPVDEANGRKGARKAPGILSVQGHDPTTDLSFRNTRVAELPKSVVGSLGRCVDRRRALGVILNGLKNPAVVAARREAPESSVA